MGCSVVETFGEKGQARDLDEVLRLEYRSKLLNPKWAQVRICPVTLLMGVGLYSGSSDHAHTRSAGFCGA